MGFAAAEKTALPCGMNNEQGNPNAFARPRPAGTMHYVQLATHIIDAGSAQRADPALFYVGIGFAFFNCAVKKYFILN